MMDFQIMRQAMASDFDSGQPGLLAGGFSLINRVSYQRIHSFACFRLLFTGSGHDAGAFRSRFALRRKAAPGMAEAAEIARAEEK
jgi:hypothetical protein